MKRIVLLLCVLFLCACSPQTKEVIADAPTEKTEAPAEKNQEPAQAMDDVITSDGLTLEDIRQDFDAVFPDFEAVTKKNGDKYEMHLVCDIPENATFSNWDEVKDAILEMTNKYSDVHLLSYLESKEGKIYATAFNGKIQYDAYAEHIKSLDTILAEATLGEQNAYKKALSYLSFTAFSYNGLIEQLEFEKFTHAEAVFAADYCGADWNEQAAKKAESYLSHQAFSRDRLIEQLEFEGFTEAQAVYGVSACGY